MNATKVEEVVKAQPYANHKATIYVGKIIAALKSVKTQREIANEAGYGRPNMISMMKRGEVRIPQDKILPLAKALMVDPGHLLRLILEDQNPTLRDTIKVVLGGIVSQNEQEWLAELRKYAGDMDPKLTPDLKKRIKEVMKGVVK